MGTTMTETIVRLNGKGQSIAIDDQGSLVVEWYDFGDDAPYESANMLIFDQVAQCTLAIALGHTGTLDARSLATLLSNRFATYFEIKEFVTSHNLPCERGVDFMP